MDAQLPSQRQEQSYLARPRLGSDLCCEVRSELCWDIDFERLSDLCRSVVNFVKLIGEVSANGPSQPGKIGRLPSGHPVARV